MTPPSHLILNLALLGRWTRSTQAPLPCGEDKIPLDQAATACVDPSGAGPRASRSEKPSNILLWLAIALGAIVPDLPRCFSQILKQMDAATLAGAPLAPASPWSGFARGISAAHTQIPWSDLIDGFHSIPLALGLLVPALLVRSRALTLAAASILLHDIEDLLSHTCAPHHHFWPLTSWTFRCPLPLWAFEFAHNRYHLGILEAILALAASGALYRMLPGWRSRWLLLAAALVYFGLGLQTTVALILDSSSYPR